LRFSGSAPGSSADHVGRLDDVDLSLSLSKEEAEKKLAKLQPRMLELRLVLAGLQGDTRPGPPVCVIF